MNTVDKQLIEHWNKLRKKPKLIVFDLDFTLWPVFIDYFSDGSLTKSENAFGQISLVNENGIELNSYPDVTRILKTLKEHCLIEGQHLAVASRANNSQLALKAIDYLEWADCFSSFQVHPGSKVIHMNDIKFDLKLDKFSDVLFFDDDHRNIIELNAIGVRAHQLNYETGLNIKEMINGLNMFQQ